MKAITTLCLAALIPIGSLPLAAAPLIPEESVSFKLSDYSRSFKKPKRQSHSSGSDHEEEDRQKRSGKKKGGSKLDKYSKSTKPPAKHHKSKRKGGKYHGKYHGDDYYDHYDRPYRRFHRRRYHRRHYYGPLYRTEVHIHEPSEVRYAPVEEPLSDDESRRINQKLDRYDDLTGIFQIGGGLSGNPLDSNGIYGFQGYFMFNAPPGYGNQGRLIRSWGAGIQTRAFRENGTSLNSNRLFVEGRLGTIHGNFIHSWGGRIGLHVLSADQTSAGFLFGLNYALYNLPSNYSFHIGYQGSLFNLGSSQFEPVLESSLESFFRLYTGQLHWDWGVEINATDIEADTYFTQFFVRTGFRF